MFCLFVGESPFLKYFVQYHALAPKVKGSVLTDLSTGENDYFFELFYDEAERLALLAFRKGLIYQALLIKSDHFIDYERSADL